MKNILLFLTLFFASITSAQNYDKMWERAISFETNGRIKPAADVADSIYNIAKSRKNEPQIIKAFFFRSKYLQILDEDAQVKIIKALQLEINAASAPARAILESIYAEALSEIYAHNRNAIDARTSLNAPAGKDMLTWTVKDYREQITAAYQRSLANREVLYKKPLKDYETIINFNPKLAFTNRSVYDFLAERYLNDNINYYESGYADLNKLMPQLEKLLGTTNNFLEFKMPDSLSPGFTKRLQLMQDMEVFYSNKKDTYSLQRATIRRLKYLDGKFHDERVNKVQINTLQQCITQWDKSPFAYRAKLMLAILLRNTADKSKNPDNLKKAVTIFDDIIANAKLNDAAAEAINTRNSILTARLDLTTENYIIPNTPILTQVQFKNLDSVEINLYKITYKETAKGKYDKDILKWKDLQKPVVTKMYRLPDKHDNFEYTTEIVLPQLPKGFYIIEAGLFL